MTHSYPLYRTVDAECLCCRSVQPIYFWSENQPVVCKSCERHQGLGMEKIKQRDKDHVGLWGSTLALLTEEHQDEVRQLRSQLHHRDERVRELDKLVEDLQMQVRGKLAEAPEGVVRAWFDSLAIDAANRDVDRAYRSRDHAYRSLWLISEAHHAKDVTAVDCSCGKKTDQGAVFLAVERVASALEHWEEKQLQRLREGHSQSLPFEHPEVQRRHRASGRLAG